ncbi:MAG: cytochrome-c peroxidase [Archangiaceae bacterium]|nr:cytochrome-c peroxidase [Archangiaceae bacterium]
MPMLLRVSPPTRVVCLTAAVVLAACAPEAPIDNGGGGGGGSVASKAHRTTVPLLGGTVTTAGGGDFAVVSDPERDLVYVIDAKAGRLHGTIRLPTGSQPTRGVEDANGQVRVALRGTGQVATISVATARLIRNDSVCPEPRGLAWDGSRNALHVACASGELVTIPTVGSTTVRRFDQDLRDVVVSNGKVRVSTFRSAMLIDVSETPSFLPLPSIALPAVANQPASFEPSVAWRTVSGGDGVTVTAHQRSVQGDIDAIRVGLAPVVVPYYTNPCDSSVVRSVITVANEKDVISSFEVGAVLPVDVAVSPDRTELAVVGAGNSAVVRVPLAGQPVAGGLCGVVPARPPEPDMLGRPSATFGQPVGVAYVSSGLLVHSRSPPRVVIVPPQTASRPVNVVIDLEGTDDAEDQGFRLFHTSSRGISCASCHPEGLEDGHVWTFFGKQRRTQALAGGISQSAPFHWKGDLPNLTSLVGDTFVARMGGTMPDPTQIAALTTFLDQIPVPRVPTRAQPVDMTKGRAAFEKAGCHACHSGARFTNDSTMAIGLDETWQVPSLRGVSRRAPFMHNGCARTMDDRFKDPSCGGRSHGDVSVLDDTEKAQLTAYLGQL